LNASFLEKNGTAILSSDADLDWLTISILDDSLEIYSDKKCRMKILATGIEAVRFNDIEVPFIQSEEYVFIQ